MKEGDLKGLSILAIVRRVPPMISGPQGVRLVKPPAISGTLCGNLKARVILPNSASTGDIKHYTVLNYI